MVPANIAALLLHDCPHGPVYDFLVTAAGKKAATAVTVAPADDKVTWQLLQGLNVDDTIALVTRITSPALLHRLVSKDKRKNVRRALAANPNLADEDVNVLAVEACGYDQPLAKSLYEARSPAGRVTLLLDHPRLGLILDAADLNLACDVHNAGDDTLFRRAVVEFSPTTAKAIVETVCHLGDQTPRIAVTSVVEATATLAVPDHSTRSWVAGYVCTHGTDAEVARAVRELNWRELRALVAAKRPHCAAELILNQTTDARELLSVAAVLSAGGVQINDDTAGRIADGYQGQLTNEHRHLNVTSLGRERFLTAASDDVAAWFALHHDDPRVRADVLRRRLRPQLAKDTFLTVDEMLTIVDDGPVEQACGEVAWDAMSAYSAKVFGKLDPRLVDVVYARGPVALVADLKDPLSVEVVDLLLDRISRGTLLPSDAVLRKALTVEGLDVQRRRSLLMHLSASGLLSRQEHLQPGELRWLLEHRPDRDDLVGRLSRKVSPTAYPTAELWPEVVDLLPLDWTGYLGSCPDEPANSMRTYLCSRFGDNITLWETALSLLPEWKATLAELVAAVETLVD